MSNNEYVDGDEWSLNFQNILKKFNDEAEISLENAQLSLKGLKGSNMDLEMRHELQLKKMERMVDSLSRVNLIIDDVKKRISLLTGETASSIYGRLEETNKSCAIELKFFVDAIEKAMINYHE